MIFQLSFDWKTKYFEYEYSLQTLDGVSAVDAEEHPTEIVVPEMQYPNGSYQVQVSPPAFTWRISSTAPNVIEIIKDESAENAVGEDDGDIVKVIVAHANAIF